MKKMTDILYPASTFIYFCLTFVFCLFTFISNRLFVILITTVISCLYINHQLLLVLILHKFYTVANVFFIFNFLYKAKILPHINCLYSYIVLHCDTSYIFILVHTPFTTAWSQMMICNHNIAGHCILVYNQIVTFTLLLFKV